MKVTIDGVRYVPAKHDEGIGDALVDQEALMRRMWMALVGSGSSNRLDDWDKDYLSSHFGFGGYANSSYRRVSDD